jgi:hypothetical protein
LWDQRNASEINGVVVSTPVSQTALDFSETKRHQRHHRIPKPKDVLSDTSQQPGSKPSTLDEFRPLATAIRRTGWRCRARCRRRRGPVRGSRPPGRRPRRPTPNAVLGPNSCTAAAPALASPIAGARPRVLRPQSSRRSRWGFAPHAPDRAPCGGSGRAAWRRQRLSRHRRTAAQVSVKSLSC